MAVTAVTVTIENVYQVSIRFLYMGSWYAVVKTPNTGGWWFRVTENRVGPNWAPLPDALLNAVNELADKAEAATADGKMGVKTFHAYIDPVPYRTHLKKV